MTQQPVLPRVYAAPRYNSYDNNNRAIPHHHYHLEDEGATNNNYPISTTNDHVDSNHQSRNPQVRHEYYGHEVESRNTKVVEPEPVQYYRDPAAEGASQNYLMLLCII